MGVLHIHVIVKVGHPNIISTHISEQKILMWFWTHNIPKRNKLSEKISQKNPECMLNYSLPCSCSWILSSFWFILKQQFLFLVTAAILNGGRAVGHNFERDPPKDHPCQVWFNLVQWFQRKRFKCDLLSKYA
jgi:hypothetical protein